MFCEEIRVPGLPGEEDVTDGSVDYYEMDWVVVDNGVSEAMMPRAAARCCACADTTRCTGNSPAQSDADAYEITQE